VANAATALKMQKETAAGGGGAGGAGAAGGGGGNDDKTRGDTRKERVRKLKVRTLIECVLLL
jgi:hypothetical protein